jgi:hypothetical protein
MSSSALSPIWTPPLLNNYREPSMNINRYSEIESGLRKKSDMGLMSKASSCFKVALVVVQYMEHKMICLGSLGFCDDEPGLFFKRHHRQTHCVTWSKLHAYSRRQLAGSIKQDCLTWQMYNFVPEIRRKPQEQCCQRFARFSGRISKKLCHWQNRSLWNIKIVYIIVSK